MTSVAGQFGGIFTIILTYVCVCVFIGRRMWNYLDSAVGFLFLGASSNALVMSANAGKMPISCLLLKFEMAVVMRPQTYTCIHEGTRFASLGDVIPNTFLNSLMSIW
jgi:hypothetical protein